MLPKELLPSDLMNSAFIAGGYAACPALASDIDLWVMAPPNQLGATRKTIINWLETEMWPYEVQEDQRLSVLGPAAAYGYDVIAGKVAIVKSPHMTHPIHIMVVDRSPAELLETFDISTHQVAIVFGNVVKGSGWTPVTVPPVMLRNTPTTPERMRKIAARYGHPVPFEITEAQ